MGEFRGRLLFDPQLEVSILDTLRNFMRRLGTQEDERHFSADDSRMALAALLVHSVAIDGLASPEERAKLRELLARNFGLSGTDVELLIADATTAENEAVDLYRFTSVLKRQMSHDARIRVIENLWEMAYADGRSHEFEENLIWRVAELLGVSPRNRIAMKRLVAENKSVSRNTGG
jgi:uncharacterized tellurite resistance protein B-like protein